MRILALTLLTAASLPAQLPPGLGLGYLGELEHIGRQIVQLAEAVPEEKYSWRPAPGIMSVAEVYTHVYLGTYSLLAQAGHRQPADLVTKPKTKAEIVAGLKRALADVKTHYQATSPQEQQRPLKLFGAVDSRVENVYLRILAHLSEHMGQSIAYARMNGIAPPWSVPPGKKTGP